MGLEIVWWVYSLLAMGAFTAMVLLLRYAFRYIDAYPGITILIGGLGFLFPLVWLLQGSPIPQNISWPLLLTAVFFNVTGNLGDFNGIKHAPNPGYAVAIRSGHTILVVLASWLFISSVTLTLWHFVFIVVAFIGMSGLAMIGGKRSASESSHAEHSVTSWQFHSLLAMVSFTVVVLCARQLSDMASVGMDRVSFSFFFNAVLWPGTFIGLLLWGKYKGMSLLIPKKVFLIILGATIFSALANFFDYVAVGLSPNPGYANALKGAQLIPITVLAYFIFKDVSLTLRHLLFTVVTFVGIAGVILLK